MNATVSAPAAMTSQLHTRPVSLLRLTATELRKLADTRSGWWLLLLIALSTAGTAVTLSLTDSSAERTISDYLSSALFASSILLPILGILSATGEWSHRTAVSTYTLVPARGRVTTAKLAAIVLMALGSTLVALTASALAAAVADLRSDSSVWTLDWSTVWHLAVAQVIGILMGFAFGTLLLNGPLAIVSYYVLPIAWTVLGSGVAALARVAPWLDTSATLQPLSGEQVTSGQWARVAVSVLVWVAVPLTVGAMRVHRRDVA